MLVNHLNELSCNPILDTQHKLDYFDHFTVKSISQPLKATKKLFFVKEEVEP